MYTIGTSCRRGTSTIYGVMIFVGIMFTAVIPMFLVMNQADTLHEIRKVEVGRLDEENAMEDIYFYLEPTVEDGLPVITLKISNIGELAVRIKSVWINDTLRDDFDCIIPPISDRDLKLDSLIVPNPPPESVTYHVMAVTDRGNIFSPACGIPKYNPGIATWNMDDFMIYVMMSMPTNSLHILVEKEIGGNFQEFINEPVLSHRSIYEISVQAEGTYRVTVYRFYGTTHPEILLNKEVVELSLLKSSDVVWVP